MANKNKQKVQLKDFMNEASTHVKDGVLHFANGASVKEVADALNKKPAELIQYFFMKKEMLNINSPLAEEQIAEISLNYDLDFKVLKKVDESNILDEVIEKATQGELPDLRPPIITIMGHVDHGKTTLLDSIRKSNITSGEAGGITQSIGAYQIIYNKKRMTFIDTPGHEAFTEMRARGSKITDIIIIVVAADDSVMPQTVESIDHAKAANIPIIVAINKIDAPHADIEKVKTDVAAHGLNPEEWGGDVPFIPLSAINGDGIDLLLDSINLIAEVEDYKTNNNDSSAGVVIETYMEKGKGNVVTILIQHGTLNQGDSLILDTEISNVRVMYDDMGKEIKKANTSSPVKITGFPVAPDLGSKFVAVHNLKEAKKIAKIRQRNKKDAGFKNSHSKKMNDFLKPKDGSKNQKVLSVILKADSTGSIEALAAQVLSLSNEKVQVNIIRSDMGQITKADILLSQANMAPIYTFNLNVSQTIKDSVDKHKTKFFSYDVIYHLLEDMRKHMLGVQDTEYKEIELGKAKVIALFTFSKVGTIAGCSLLSGKATNKSKIRLKRNEEEIFNGDLSSLKIEKDAVKEVIGVGKEFALTIKNFDAIKENDAIEFYELEEIIYE